MKVSGFLFASLIAIGVSSQAETVKDREAAVRKDRETMVEASRWVYNDVSTGFAKAKETGKPLLVVLRCVPCMACMGIDTSVLGDASLNPLLDQFVCARVINANDLDLARFQFDFDLSFSTLIFEADGTVLGRFGSWTHQKNSQDTATESYRRALEAALALHKNYPGNKAWLAGKQGGPTPYKTPVEFPALAGKYQRSLDWEGKVVQSCVHCHQVGDAFRAYYRDQKKPIPQELIYPMPAPETIGLMLAPDQVAHVDSVLPASVAANAGVQAGDDVLAIGGQALISIADAAWALNRAPNSGSLTIIVKRSGAAKSLTLALPSGWRTKSDISKRVGTWPMRGMATGGLVLEDLDDQARSGRHIDANGMALFVKGLGQSGKHGAAKNAGFQKDDVLVGIDGLSKRMTEGELIGHLLQNHQPGEQVKTIVLRGEERVELKLPMQ
jgi:hypothetical protein